MTWETLMIIVAGFIGGILGYLLTRGVVKNVGLPFDERGNEIAKIAAARTLEVVLLTVVIALYYSLFVAGDELCTATLSGLLALIFFVNLALRVYYGRRM